MVGIDFSGWGPCSGSPEACQAVKGVNCDDGAAFFMDPDHGATTEPVVIAQLTVQTGHTFRGQFSAQGRTVSLDPNDPTEDWTHTNIWFDSDPAGGPPDAPPPPPTPPSPPPVNTVDHCWLPPNYDATPCLNGGSCANDPADSTYVCACTGGFSGLTCERSGSGRPPPPPPSGGGGKDEPPTQAAAPTPLPTDGLAVDGQLNAMSPQAVYSFAATAGQTYMIETELGTLQDSILNLYSTDRNTKIAENDDDERTNNRLASYIEWTCPVTGTYFAEVACFDCSLADWMAANQNPLTFQINIAQATGADDPCAGPGGACFSIVFCCFSIG